MAKYKNKNTLIWKIKRGIKNYFLLDLLSFIYIILESFVPKKRNSLLYFFSVGEGFSDNSKYLFEHINRAQSFNQTLLVVDKKLYHTLKIEYPKQTINGLSFKGLICFLRHKTVIVSTGIDRISFYPYLLEPKKKNIIQLWHGSLFKRLGFQVKNWNQIKSKKEYQKYDAFITCSDLENKLAASCFNLSPDQTWATNYPRNDYILNPSEDLTIEHPFLAKKTILYAPTWREEGHKVEFFPFKDTNLLDIQKLLEANDAYLLIRGHASEMERIADLYDLNINDTNRIISAHQGVFPRTEQLLPHIDILITDYSGIAIDYLLLNRPIIYIPYDLELYCEYRGILYDYDQFIAGKAVDTQEDFLKALQTYLSTPIVDEYLRIEKQRLFHNNTNGKACERIEAKLKKLTRK